MQSSVKFKNSLKYLYELFKILMLELIITLVVMIIIIRLQLSEPDK